jgi:hypothetical protein
MNSPCNVWYPTHSGPRQTDPPDLGQTETCFGNSTQRYFSVSAVISELNGRVGSAGGTRNSGPTGFARDFFCLHLAAS